MVNENLQISENENVEQIEATRLVENTNYNAYSIPELIRAMEHFCTRELVETHRIEVETIRSVYYKKINQDRIDARQAYIDQNGSDEGFIFDSQEREFKEVYGRIKNLRASLVKAREDEQSQNLARKQAIIEKIENLTNTEESMNKTFTEFKSLQDEWKSVGEVPQANDKAIWEKYHLAVAKFYNYVQLNREFRDLDQKRNYEVKVKLCEAAEKLANAPQVVKAFAELQSLHLEWKKIGPVKEDVSEQIWERFKTATSVVNKAHQDYFTNLKEQEKQNLDKKTALCERIETIIADLNLSQKQWNDRTNKVNDIRNEWKTIGFVPQKQNAAIYERFKTACDTFFAARKEFLGEVRSVENDNKKLKIELCERAEQMQSRTDWREATADFVQLQKDWKKIGSTSFRDSQKLWNRFTTACNAFFDAKNAESEKISQEFENNIPAKEALIAKLAEVATDNKDEALKVIAQIQEEWKSIQVPARVIKDLQKKFAEAIQAVLAKLNLDKSVADNMAFRIKISAMMLENDGAEKVVQEAKRLKNRLTTINNEVKSLENNIGFFRKSPDASKMMAKIELSINKGKEECIQVEQKLKIINTILRKK